MNRVELIGNLTKDVVLNTTVKGKKYCFFTLAVNRESSNGADFIFIKAWDKLAESCAATLHKGDKAKIVARLVSSNYEKGGEKQISTTVTAVEVARISKGSDNFKSEVTEIPA